MTQTLNDIRDNIVKIIDENNNFLGTGFFFKRGYCITCHHNIARADKIFVTRDNKKLFAAEWLEEYSDPRIDLAILRVRKSIFKPLEVRTETYHDIDVVVWGFSDEELAHFPSGNHVEGHLAKVSCPIQWNKEMIAGKRKWNVKPEVNVNVIKFDGSFKVGYSGAPVCYAGDWTVVGIFEAKDENSAYIIPTDIVFDRSGIRAKMIMPSSGFNIQYVMDKAWQYLNNGEFSKAIRYYDKVINDPRYLDAWTNKGAALGDSGKWHEALACFDYVLKYRPDASYLWYNKALSLLHLGRLKEAVCLFDKCLQLDKENAEALANKANALFELGKFNESLTCANKALRIDPNNATAWNEKGLNLDKKGRFKKAIECFDRALKINPKWAWIWSNKGLSYLHQGDKDQAILCFDKALSIDSGNAGIWSNKAIALVEINKTKEALKCVSKALELDPLDAKNWEVKAIVLFHSEKPREAKKYEMKAEKLRKLKRMKLEPISSYISE